MNKEMTFAFKGTNKVLEKLIIERDKGINQSYKTLVNAFNEYARIFLGKPITSLFEDEKLSFSLLVDKLSDELSKLEKVVESSLENGDYKAHHNWVYSYNNLVNHKNGISEILRKQNSYKSLSQYKTQPDTTEKR